MKRQLRQERISVNDIDEASSTLTYMGKEDGDGIWIIQKIDESSNPTLFTYASEKNNSSYKTYSAAWTARAGLNYNNYEVAV